MLRGGIGVDGLLGLGWRRGVSYFRWDLEELFKCSFLSFGMIGLVLLSCLAYRHDIAERSGRGFAYHMRLMHRVQFAN